MRKYTKKQLKSLVETGMARDITKAGNPGNNYSQIGYSAGKFGVTGALLQNRESGEFTAILARNSQLFRYC